MHTGPAPSLHATRAWSFTPLPKAQRLGAAVFGLLLAGLPLALVWKAHLPRGPAPTEVVRLWLLSPQVPMLLPVPAVPATTPPGPAATLVRARQPNPKERTPTPASKPARDESSPTLNALVQANRAAPQEAPSAPADSQPVPPQWPSATPPASAASAASAPPRLRLDAPVLRQAAREAVAGSLPAPNAPRSAQERLGQAVADTAKPDCVGKDSGGAGLLSPLVWAYMAANGKCK